jgi:hypothetical protein
VARRNLRPDRGVDLCGLRTGGRYVG